MSISLANGLESFLDANSMSKKYMIKVNGKVYEVEVEEVTASDTQQNVQLAQQVAVQPTQNPVVDTVSAPQQVKPAPASNIAKAESTEKSRTSEKTQISSSQEISSEVEKVVAPMSGTVLKVNVKPGDTVKDSQTLVVIEAMKMENEILAPRNAKIREIFVKNGQQVDMDQPLLTIE